MAKTTKQTAVSQVTKSMIEALNEQLENEFGKDYSFTVHARGHMVAASTMEFGDVQPVLKFETI